MTRGAMWTATGRVITPLDPKPNDIAIEDIAHALANSCRFTGHVREFYSVAQHSVIVSSIVAPKHALVGLLHDASEAYLSDIARPIKEQPEFGSAYRDAEDRLMRVIAERFGFQWPMPNEVVRADNILLRSEMRDLMHPSCPTKGYDFLSYKIEPWEPRLAECKFLVAYHDITGYSRRIDATKESV